MIRLYLIIYNSIQASAVSSFLPQLAADPFDGKGVQLNGWGLLNYYTSLIGNYMSEYAVPIQICYAIVVACIVVMALLYIMFLKDYLVRRRNNSNYDSISKKFHDSFLEILSNDKLTITEMEEIIGCKKDELLKYKTSHMGKLIASIRMELYEVIYLPNLQTLADITGVLQYYETNLLKGRNVFEVLQTLLMFQIVITEGRLAGYVNSHDSNVRMMARMLYIICSQNDPYYYLLDDLNKPQSMIRPMLLHYIFGWRKEQNKLMPDFLALADQIENDDMAAFMIMEVAHWGNADEKRRIPEYFLSRRQACRSAAIHVTANLADADAEDKLVESFPSQPQETKHEILRAMLVIRSGRHIPFLEQVIKESSSHTTRELALSCLYNHGAAGRMAFEKRRGTASEEERKLMDQIDSTNVLTQIQSLR